MAYKTFSDGVALPASDLNTYLMRQSVTKTTAAHSGLPTPAEGDVVYETDTDSLFVYTTATTGWRAPWNMPWGQLAYVQVTTGAGNTGLGSTATDLVSLTTGALTLPANRRVKITAQVRTSQNTSTGTIVLGINDSVAGTIGQATNYAVATAIGWQVVSAVVTPASGAHTYKLQLSTTAGTVDLVASSTQPASILVEDIGPAGAPA